MIDIIGKRKLWFIISFILVVPGTLALIAWGLKPGIDFTGGQEMEVSGKATQEELRDIVAKSGVKDITVTTSGESNLLVRYSDKDTGETEQVHQNVKVLIQQGGLSEVSFSSVGPSVSRDITRNALLGVGLASIAILLYISFAFRNTPPPVTSWSFGGTAIFAMLHDALFVLGVFAILGHFYGIQVDSLFVTALLTVIGFSVHDTIVVYDRIRENLRRLNKPFEEVANISINETLARSLNTSITVIIVLLAFYLFGGESIRNFVLALLIGIIAGTYSSIFFATPSLVVYNNWKIKRSKSKGSKNIKKAKSD